MTITFLTGAGISQESGIETFRGQNGLWGEYKTEEVATIEAWEKNPDLCCDFYAERRAKIAQAQPNAAHLAITQFQQDCPDLNIQIITQNVDDLHERAGSKNILHLHGQINEILVETEAGLMITDYTKELHHCKPNVVMFGEEVPNMEPAVETVEQSDILIIVGTSLQVYPANTLMDYLPTKAKTYDVNPDSTTTDPNIIKIQKTAVNGLPELIKQLQTLSEY